MLEIVAEGSPLGATDLATRLKTSKATAFRLARTLQANGYLEQMDDTRYRLGPRCQLLGARGTSELDLRKELHWAMEELHAQTEETILLTVLAGRFAVCLDSIPSTRAVVSVATVGTVWPAHACSGGLAILSQSDKLLDSYLSEPLTRHTENTITDPEELRDVLAEAREVGYAVNINYFRAEVCAVSAVVRQKSEEPVAALSVMLPEFRLHEAGVEFLGQTVRSIADQASRRLGGETA
jgi:DNA-binding IclR family transcriptional regulator